MLLSRPSFSTQNDSLPRPVRRCGRAAAPVSAGGDEKSSRRRGEASPSIVALSSFAFFWFFLLGNCASPLLGRVDIAPSHSSPQVVKPLTLALSLPNAGKKIQKQNQNSSPAAPLPLRLQLRPAAAALEERRSTRPHSWRRRASLLSLPSAAAPQRTAQRPGSSR